MKRSMTTLALVLKYMGIGMALIYVLAGISILTGKLFHIPEPYVVPIGICLTGYGVFRGYRLYEKHFKNRS